MPRNSFSLYATAKSVTQMLRAKLHSAPADSAELQAALGTIQSLWEELLAQSEVLKDERQRFADFFEFAPDAYVITEPGGACREANRAARDLLGINDAEPTEEAPLLVAFIPEAERSAFRERLITVRGHPEGQAVEWQGNVISKDGAALPVLFRVRAMKVRRKNADGLCWVLQPAVNGSR